MKQGEHKTAQQIIDEIDKKNEHLNKLDKIREERSKLKIAPNTSRMNKEANL